MTETVAKAVLPRVLGAGEHGHAHPVARATRRHREEVQELVGTVRGLLGALDHSLLCSQGSANMVGKHEHTRNASRAQDCLDEAYSHTLDAATTCSTLKDEVAKLGKLVGQIAEVQENAGALIDPTRHPAED